MPNIENESGLLTLSRVSKQFGATQALSDISVTFNKGEVHSIVGENGAGKSTLGKVLLGIHQSDRGEIIYKGEVIKITSPAHGVNLGLVGIAQELSLLPNRTVADNIALGREITVGPFVNSKKTRERVLAVMDQYNMHLDPDILVGALPVAEQQKVEILRALSREADLIVFDEPTARLASHEAEQLRDLVRNLAKRGKAVVYVSHFLEEVLAISDKITILRNGEYIRTSEAKSETRDSLIEAMTGADVQNQFPKLNKFDENAPPILNIQNLTRNGEFDNISFKIRPGEILGLAGLVGAGRSEIAHAIYGGTSPDSGKITFCDEDVSHTNISKSLRLGMAMVPEARREQGLVLGRPILENISLPYLHKFTKFFGLDKRSEFHSASHCCEVTSVKHSGLNLDIDTLSGGNQQKILFARAVLGTPKLLIADEPTRGVDVGAKRGIYNLIHELAANGEAILLISSEIEEILGLCHRTLVISQGKIAAEFKDKQMTKAAIMQAAFSGV